MEVQKIRGRDHSLPATVSVIILFSEVCSGPDTCTKHIQIYFIYEALYSFF